MADDEIKVGARNNANDRGAIRKIRSLAVEITNHTLSLEPDDVDPQPEQSEIVEIPLAKGDALVGFGSEIKYLGVTDEGYAHLGGYLVRFSDAATPDLTGDYFTAETDFGMDEGEQKTVPVYFNHGQPLKTREGGEILITRKIGKGTLALDDVGILIDAIIYNRDEYEQAISAQAKSLGWSSGALGHLVERDYSESASLIKRWIIGEGSLTPTPAEPRNSVIPLKSLSELFPPIPEPEGEPEAVGDTAASDGEGAAGVVNSIKSIKKEINPMEITEERLQEMLDSAATKAVDSLKTNGNGGVNVQVVEDEADKAARLNPFKSFGEQLKSVRDAATGEITDVRLKAMKQLGLNEGLPSEGGFLVQQDFSTELLRNAYGGGVLASRVRRMQVSANSNGMKINAIAETSRATGSRAGGLQTYWLGEAGTKLPSMPAFRQIDLNLKKLIGLYYSTDELLQDASALQSLMSQLFAEEFAWMLDEAILNGTGVGQPLGILNSPALVTQAAEVGQAIDTVVSENVIKMYSRMPARNRGNAIWIYNQDIEPQLFTMGLTVGLGGIATYMPPGGLSDAPYGRLLGRPAIPMEQADNLGDVGDIVFVDPSEYYTIEKGGIQSASSIHVAFLTDQSAFRFVYRFDGQPAWVSPLTPANGATTLSPFVTLAAR